MAKEIKTIGVLTSGVHARCVPLFVQASARATA